MHPEIQIENRKIGYNHPPLVIAEIGINHEGSLEVAKEMVDAAHAAGAEMVKHQTHIVEDEMSGAAKETIPGEQLGNENHPPFPKVIIVTPDP